MKHQTEQPMQITDGTGLGNVQLFWTAGGESFMPESLQFWCAYTGQPVKTVQNWGWLKAVHPDDREQLKRHWAQVIVSKNQNETKCRLLRANGRYYSIRLKLVPLRKRNNTIKEWIGWIMDATSEPTHTQSATTELLQGQTLYRLMFEQVSVGMLCTALDGEIRESNEKFCQSIGYSRDELLEKNVQDLIYSDDRKISNAFTRQLLVGRVQPYTFEIRYTHKNGSLVWAKVNTTVLQLPSNEPQFFLSTVEDITFQKRAEEERTLILKQAQATQAARRWSQEQAMDLARQFKAVFAAITEHVVFFNAEGRILQANAAALELFGWDSEQTCLGKLWPEFFHGYDIRNEHEQILDLEQLPMARILRGEVLPQTHAIDIIIHLSDKQRVELSISGAPVHDPEGRTIGGVCVFREVTEQRQKERRLQQTLDSLLTLVEALVDIPELVGKDTIENLPLAERAITATGQRLADLIRDILECDQVGLVTIEPETDQLHAVGMSGYSSEEEQVLRAQVNQSTIFDYADEESIALLRSNNIEIRNINDQPFVARTAIGANLKLFAPMFVGKQMVGIFTISKTQASGSYTEEEIALVKAVGRLTALIIERVRLLNDWAQAHVNEMVLQEANERFDAFMGIASHELRTPLTTIKGNIQLAMRRLDTLRSQTRDLSETVQNKLERLKNPLEYAVHRVGVQDRMITDLLDTSRIRANEFSMVFQPTNLSEIVRSTTEDIQLSAPDRTILFPLPDTNEIIINADPDRIGQVVSNFLGNALKYSAIDQPVEITIEIQEGKQAYVAFHDRGPGLTAKQQKHIWERFYRAEGIETQYGSGTGLGLGLYLCRMIVENHDGQVGLSSISGEGSTFWFTLPLLHVPSHYKNE